MTLRNYDYIVVSPVGAHRSFVLWEFIDAISRFDPAPKEIVLCVDWDEFDLRDEIKNRYPTVKLLINSNIGYGPGELQRIGYAREMLRNYFIKTNYNFCLWIDSDIICPSNFPSLLIERHKVSKSAVHCHPYLGRGNRLWTGSGIMFTSKCACSASTFYVAMDSAECHVSEDYAFLAIIRYASGYFFRFIDGVDLDGIDYEEVCFDIYHYIKEGLSKEEIMKLTNEARVNTTP